MSSFPLSDSIPLVLDTSVAINLNATNRAAEIIRAFPNPFVVTEIVFQELVSGGKWGHRDAEEFSPLIASGLVRKVNLGQEGLLIFEAFVDGAGRRTLQDGEASTVAYARGSSGIALLDENKARRICADEFPDLRVVRTIELFLHRTIAEAFGAEAQADIVFQAIKKKRMHVGPDYLQQALSLIGDERAALCSSLPRSARAKRS